jgi:hypothetical protein
VRAASRTALGFVLLLLLASSIPAGTTSGAIAARVAAEVLPASVHPGDSLTPYGNLSVPLTEPNVSLPARTDVVVRYQFEVAAWPAGLSNLTVWVASELAIFREPGGETFEVTVPGLNQTVSSSSLSDPNATVGNNSVGTGGATFLGGSTALLSSQLLAVMVSVPWGTLKLEFRWNWESIAPSGATAYSPWSSFQTISPPEHLAVVSDGPDELSPGQSFNVCIAGPIQDRTFSLHMEVPSPYWSFAWNTTTVPANWTGTYCWSDEMPSSFNKLPSALLVHIWEYNTLPSILYILHTEAVAPNGGIVTGRISPASADAQLGNFRLSLSPTVGLYRLVVTPGTYWLGANASGFLPGGFFVEVESNTTTWANLSLAVAPGTLTGDVTPAQALVTVDGSPLAVNVQSGNFSASLPPGTYWWSGQATGFITGNGSVVVTSGQSTFLDIDLAAVPNPPPSSVSPPTTVTPNPPPSSSSPNGVQSAVDRLAPGSMGVYLAAGLAVGVLFVALIVTRRRRASRRRRRTPPRPPP